MTSAKLFPKPCSCAKDQFLLIHKTEKELKDNIQIEREYDIRNCSKCKKDWGPAKNFKETHESNQFLEEYRYQTWELTFFRKYFNSLTNPIRQATLEVNIKKINENYEYPIDIIERWMRAGFIIKDISRINYNLKIKCKFYFTQKAKNYFQTKFNLLSINKQKSMTLNLLNSTLIKIHPNSSPLHQQLQQILSNQIQFLDQNAPKWQLSESEFIEPKNFEKIPRYFLFSMILCNWYLSNRPIIMLRELSSKTFTGTEYEMEKDPSKILKVLKLHKDLKKFVKYNLDYPNLFSVGIIENIQIFHCTGSISLLFQKKESRKSSDKPFFISNLEYTDIETIQISNSKILLVENLAVFTYLCVNKFSEKYQSALCYIGGQPSSFVQTVISKIEHDNSDLKWNLWVDWDYGGYRIYQKITNIVDSKITLFNIINVNTNPFSPLSSSNAEMLKQITPSNENELTFISNLIKYGSLEQEFLLEYYEEIIAVND